MLAPLVHLSLTKIGDPTKHRAYNAWRQLDYVPELMLDPGMAWADAWVQSPDCAAVASVATDTASLAFDYAQLHGFRAPEEQSARRFVDQRERAFQMGRRPDVEWARESLAAFFVPLKGYVNPRVLISANALPVRPMTGVHLTLSRFLAHDAAAEAAYRWQDRVCIPELLECTGAAGAWTFTSHELFRPARDLSAATLRLRIVYLDGDPLAFSTECKERESRRRAEGRHFDASAVEQPIFAGPLRAIVPWRWTWFESAR